jgi:hypothetical protein
MNPLDAQCDTQRDDAICVNQLKNANPIDPALLQEKPDVKIFLPFRFYLYRPEELFQPNTYNRFLGKFELLNLRSAFYPSIHLQLLRPATT